MPTVHQNQAGELEHVVRYEQNRKHVTKEVLSTTDVTGQCLILITLLCQRQRNLRCNHDTSCPHTLRTVRFFSSWPTRSHTYIMTNRFTAVRHQMPCFRNTHAGTPTGLITLTQAHTSICTIARNRILYYYCSTVGQAPLLM